MRLAYYFYDNLDQAIQRQCGPDFIAIHSCRLSGFPPRNRLLVRLQPGWETRSKAGAKRVVHLRATWDPEGLLPPVSGGHFARKQTLQHGGADALDIRALPLDIDKGEGMLVRDLEPEDKAALQQQLAERYMAVDLQREGLRIHSMDPPIFTIQNFLAGELCEAIAAAANASGQMQASKVGAGNAMAENAVNMRRTSSTLLITGEVLQKVEELQTPVQHLQSGILGLLLQGEGKQWGRTGLLPKANQLCFEQLQVACYEAGQHFLSHEDAFPEAVAEQNGFQRRATVLVYLNDAPGGGRTRFDTLDLAVQPVKGRALLFFPAFKDGRPDSRTLHMAEDAAATKWVAQQWVACGWPAAKTPTPSGYDSDEEPELLLLPKGRRGKGKKSGKEHKLLKKGGFGGFV